MHHGDVSPEIAQGLLALKKRIEAAKILLSKRLVQNFRSL